MNIPADPESLTELFRKLGAPVPEKWASSQIREGIPQLARFLVLREAWKGIVPDDSSDWIDKAIQRAEQHPAKPFAGVGLALKRCLEEGAKREDINEIVRGQQVGLLFHFLCSIDGDNVLEPEVSDFNWGLFRIDSDGHPIEPIGGLHESLISLDPSGREMRAREAKGEDAEAERLLTRMKRGRLK